MKGGGVPRNIEIRFLKIKDQMVDRLNISKCEKKSHAIGDHSRRVLLGTDSGHPLRFQAH